MNISYDAYRVFYYVAKYRSFTQAAGALQNSQPNVTRAIKNLEQALDCTLFLRSNRRVELTREGETLYRHVSAAFEQLQSGEEEVSRGKGLDGGILRIAATEVALRIFLLPVLSQFRAQYPGVHIRLLSRSTPSAVSDLEKGLADLAVVTAPTGAGKALKETHLMSFQEVAVCGSAYAFLSGTPVSVKTVAQYPLVCLGEHTITSDFYTRYFGEHGLTLTPDIEAAAADQILPLVQANLGIGFVPSAFLSGEAVGQSVFLISLDEPIPPRHICMLTSQTHPMGPAARELSKLLVRARNT